MWIEIFKSGDHTDSKGRKQNYTDSDIDNIVRKYNANVAENPAPLVKGHPKDNAPAHGWVERLARRGDKLLAKVKELSKEIIQETKEGKFGRVSISLYPDNLLRHVGILGAAKPAVMGLRKVEFSDDKDFHEFTSDVKYNQDINEKRSESHFHQEIDNLNKKIRLREFRDFAESIAIGEQQKIKPANISFVVDLLEMAYMKDKELEISEFANGEGLSFTDKVKNFFSELPKMQNILSKLETNKNYEESRDTKNYNSDRLDLHRSALNIQNTRPGTSYEEAVTIATNNIYNSLPKGV